MSKEREILDQSGGERLKKIQQTAERGRRSMLGPQGPLNTITPCAACKLLRRRCAQECPFAPYFSPHEPQKFAAVHKVFGASNVSKMLMEVPENQRADVANSLVYEANARIRDPVYGCTGTISALQQQAQSLQAELNAVREDIMRYRCENAVAAATMVSTYPSNTGDRGVAAATAAIVSRTSAASDYAGASPSSTVETPDVKERYWN